ncbi:MAG TPA: SAM-dependent methyltransferase [Streptosporangiaceae bacterium]|nr:SAM-dependent methyltransferase [Streptosporangiaceae bacterium]
MQPGVDSTKPHSARVYDYYLGGKDHFAADRDTGQRAMQSWPAVRTAVRENRAFLGRAVRYLAAEAGIRQFLDIGAGLPSADNVHEVAQAAAPESRVVYVDNDPIVLAHAQVLLASAPAGVGGLERTYRQAGIPAQARTAAEFAALAFGGLDMVEPGVVLVSQWRPPAGSRPRPDEVNWYGGIGRKTQ